MTVTPLSQEPPRPRDIKETERLRQFLQGEGLYESAQESLQREEVLGQLNDLVREWVKQVARVLAYDEDAIEAANGRIFTFGSYRLGVHGPGADIDTLAIGPAYCSRDFHFFGSQPECLEQMLREHPQVQDLSAVQDSFVPVIKMKFHGIEIDLLYAQLHMNMVDNNIDLLASSTIRNCHPASVRSLNGCRVTDTILREVRDSQKEDFKLTLKALKLWGERKGVYSNVSGYLGGVNWAILVAYVCKLYPTAKASLLLVRFFRIFWCWKWPTPVLLRDITVNETMGLLQWDPRRNHRDKDQLMPIITPCYPEQNSSYNVSESTYNVIKEQLHCSYEVLEEMLYRSAAPVNWPSLFQPDDFFNKFKLYLQIEVWAASEQMFRPWSGWVQSRLGRYPSIWQQGLTRIKGCLYSGADRKSDRLLPCRLRQLTMKLEPFVTARPWPKAVKHGPGEGPPEGTSHLYFLGVRKKQQQMSATTYQRTYQRNVNLNVQVKEFRDMVHSWDKYHPGLMDVVVSVKKHGELPLCVFPDGKRPEAAAAAAVADAAAAAEDATAAPATETAEEKREGVKRKHAEDEAAVSAGLDPKRIKPNFADLQVSASRQGGSAASQSSDQQVAAAEASLAQTGEVGEYAVPGAQSQSLAQQMTLARPKVAS